MVYSRCSIMGNKPRIRFKGFNDDWEQRKFSEITYLSGIKNKENKPYESYSISNEFGFIPQNEQFENGGTMKTADKSMYYIVTQNSFAYNPARINVGSIGYYDKPDNVIVSSLYEVFKTTEIVNDKFLWHWFKSNQFNHLIEKYQEGGVRLYFYYDKLCKGTIELPTIDEQNKISNLLESLDLYITLHQCKLEKLKLTKKALLQKLFPKNGKHIPEIRFKGFTDAWEQRKLESILIEYIEKNPGNENLPVLTSSRQGLTKQEDHFGSVQRHDISDYNVIPLGFCTYRNRSDDKTFTFNINRIVPRGLVSKFYPVFEIKNGNADFITEYLNNNTEIIKSLATNAVGTSQVVLSLRTLRNIEITLPLKEEQVAIGDLMRKLDIYITLHQRKLERLQEVKKGLLQKMFV